MIKSIFNRLNHILIGGLVVFASVLVASSADAKNKDMLIFGNTSGILPADSPGNPFGGELKVEVPEGVVSTTVDGSISSADFKDRAAGFDKLYLDGNLLITAFHENICLSVEGNKAILWHRNTEAHPPFHEAGDLGLQLYDTDSQTATVINATAQLGIKEINGCSQADASLLQFGLIFQLGGLVHIIDGV